MPPGKLYFHMRSIWLLAAYTSVNVTLIHMSNLKEVYYMLTQQVETVQSTELAHNIFPNYICIIIKVTFTGM